MGIQKNLRGGTLGVGPMYLITAQQRGVSRYRDSRSNRRHQHEWFVRSISKKCVPPIGETGTNRLQVLGRWP